MIKKTLRHFLGTEPLFGCKTDIPNATDFELWRTRCFSVLSLLGIEGFLMPNMNLRVYFVREQCFF